MRSYNLQSFTKGKNEPNNEDFFGNNDKTIVLVDGATDKSGKSYNGKTGGEILSRFLVKEVLDTSKNGTELVEHITEKIRGLYKKINPEALSNGAYRFTATLLVVRFDSGMLRITQVGDSAFRINGESVYKNDKLIDELNAEARSLYIKRTGDVAGGREYILPLLKKQHEYQNNPESLLGYSAIDGTTVPEKFIKTFKFKLLDVKCIELVSDGYFSIPDECTINAYEAQYEKVEKEDPDKWKKYKSTKSKDDRTVIIIKIDK